MTKIQTSPELIEQDKLKTVPSNGRAVELQVNPTLIVELKKKGDNYNTFKTRTLLDTGSGNNWCHKDLLNYVEYNNLGSLLMSIQVFEGDRKRRYQYVEIFYTVNNQRGSLRAMSFSACVALGLTVMTSSNGTLDTFSAW